MLKGEVYGQLRKRSVFEQVRIDPDIHTLIWPNGADFDPAILHDWRERAGAMKAMAMRWSSDAVESPNQESAT